LYRSGRVREGRKNGRFTYCLDACKVDIWGLLCFFDSLMLLAIAMWNSGFSFPGGEGLGVAVAMCCSRRTWEGPFFSVSMMFFILFSCFSFIGVFLVFFFFFVPSFSFGCVFFFLLSQHYGVSLMWYMINVWLCIKLKHNKSRTQNTLALRKHWPPSTLSSSRRVMHAV
jgi:hypothetical protein